MLAVILALSFAPGLFWLWFWYRHDKWEPEPKLLVLRVFIFGMVAALPSAAIELNLGLSEPLTMVVVAPLVEETWKLLIVLLFAFFKHECDEPMDGIVYATAAALGFATAENIGFMYGAHREGILTQTFALRALLSVPAHALFASMWGYALGVAKCRRVPYPALFVLNGLALAVLLHAVFNAIAWASGETVSLAGMLAVLLLTWLMWKLALRRMNAALAASPHGRKPAGDQ
jgi:RsiW-degrading membrane proteinase PrsW (M82 family)